MTDALEKVDGLIDERGNQERWSSWLIPGGKEEYQKIGSPKLKALVRDLARRPDEFTPTEKLSEFYDQFVKLEKTLKGQAKEQALNYIDNIAKRAFELANSETQPGEREGKNKMRAHNREIPKSPEGQRTLVRELLDQVEQNDLETYHFQNADAVNEIQSILPKVAKEIRIEADARLRLQDCSIGMRAALSGGGDTRDSGGKPVIGGLFKEKYAELNSKGRLMDGDDLNGLFQSIPGIDVGQAYMELQKAALLGKDIGRRIVKIFEKGSSEEEQKLVYQKIAKEMGGGKEAEKAVQLAMRFAWAGLEVSVWNNDLLGVDPMAEAIYLRQYREGRAQQGKDRGPEETISLIEGFGSSFLRTAVFSDRSPIFGDRRVVIRRGDADALKKYLLKIRGFEGRVLSARDLALPDPRNIDFSKTDPNAYGLYMSVRVPQILTVKSLLLKDDWSPDDMLPDSVRSWLSPMEFVDGNDILDLRYIHIVGAMGSSFRSVQRAIQLKWSYSGYRTVERALTEPLGTNDAGEPVVYISKKEWKVIADWCGASTKASLADGSRGLLGIRN